MSPYLQLPLTDFASPGPGAINGLKAIFPDLDGTDSARLWAMRFLARNQDLYWSRLGISNPPRPVNLAGGIDTEDQEGLTVVEIEHALCELSKVTRERTKEQGRSQVTERVPPRQAAVTATKPKRYPPGWRERLVKDEEVKTEVQDDVGQDVKVHCATAAVEATETRPDEDIKRPVDTKSIAGRLLKMRCPVQGRHQRMVRVRLVRAVQKASPESGSGRRRRACAVTPEMEMMGSLETAHRTAHTQRSVKGKEQRRVAGDGAHPTGPSRAHNDTHTQQRAQDRSVG